MSLLQSIAPPRLINEWALTGKPFDAKAALAAGLLNDVVPAAELDARVDWLIGRIVDSRRPRSGAANTSCARLPRCRSTKASATPNARVCT
jgi:enoyl-CoA hydratase/carnithine racemase